jgi:drug/metabolite transporter superfamily protein YnfA
MSESVFRQAANLRSSTVNAEAIIRRELSPSEALLWAGRPRLGIVFRAYDFLFIPLSLLWLAFVVFWQISILTENPLPEGVVMGTVFFIIFFLAGLYFAFGRFLVDRWLRSKTVYGVTSERVLIVSEWFDRKVTSLCLDSLADLTLSESANGSGTVTFVTTPFNYWWYSQSGWPGSSWVSIPMFELASDVRQVYETVRDARRAAIKLVN